MSFKFNFTIPDSKVVERLNFKHSEVDVIKSEASTADAVCGFLSVNNNCLQVPDESISVIKIGDVQLHVVSLKSVQSVCKNEIFLKAEAEHSDIIPGKYEGGFKIWECSSDLATFILENNICKSGDAVLELGCGAGLPGLIAYVNGASVTFQDFNSEVLSSITFPNTFLNTSLEKRNLISEMCEYLYGDWRCIKAKYYANNENCKKYDVILTSETIYEKSNYRSLLELMKSALKPQGKIYLAAKIHYFGVGGGIADFEALVQDDGTFKVTSVKSIKDGLERQILTMSFKNCRR